MIDKIKTFVAWTVFMASYAGVMTVAFYIGHERGRADFHNDLVKEMANGTTAPVLLYPEKTAEFGRIGCKRKQTK